jgi:poly-gamma-glutamate capsule biosynthesis protein CapA/YwtB (metallophosphatase superfamily)
MAKFVKYFALVLLVLSLGLLGYSRFLPNHLVQQTGHSSLEKEEIQKEITLAFVGDIMFDRGVKYHVYKDFSGDYSQLFTKVAEKLSTYDFLFGNLEGPVSDKGIDEGGIYSFRMEPQTIPVLKAVGFDVLSIANNHIFNWGQAAFTDTLERLTAGGIKYAGEAQVNVSGINITVLGFSEFPAKGIAVISDENVINSVKKARLNSDLVVVSFHFGEEYQKLPNAYQEKYARLAIDSGADLIIGHHPHVVQTLEMYNGSYIIYSLGNFIFDQYFSADTMSGGLLEVKVNTRTKKVENVVLKKVSLNKMFQIESIE